MDACGEAGLVYGLEVEANLIGQNGRLLAALAEKTGRKNLVCIFDGGNLSSQNMSWMEVFQEYVAMRDHIGWMHIKDYRVDPNLKWTGVVDEEHLRNFVPADVGDSAHEAILRDFRSVLPKLTERMKSLGAPGVFLELEPHLKAGASSAASAGRMAWVSRCGPCATCWIMWASPTACGRWTTSGLPAILKGSQGHFSPEFVYH